MMVETIIGRLNEKIIRIKEPITDVIIMAKKVMDSPMIIAFFRIFL